MNNMHLYIYCTIISWDRQYSEGATGAAAAAAAAARAYLPGDSARQVLYGEAVVRARRHAKPTEINNK